MKGKKQKPIVIQKRKFTSKEIKQAAENRPPIASLADLFPPLKVALFRNGELVSITELADPRLAFCECYNQHQWLPEGMDWSAEHGNMIAGPVQYDGEMMIDTEAESFAADIAARVAKVHRKHSRNLRKGKAGAA